ncbi:phospho-acceptor domain-containing protein [Aneurinibacillus soli]|uniref:histidine kinase n=1 Tax=Aneurinibacillus soli TaxID=1500254 RepID=A0A0U4WL89_9BACL|nr:HAMP domain-containing sensor histidine kinase [Aneurinibacillus soli]PYE59478.1 phospho-acceptor domain-containing protein [Aneurinibacillus soli]BAU29192.1 Non-motile and phage-resistance protein [Aneurinibacillus soli]
MKKRILLYMGIVIGAGLLCFIGIISLGTHALSLIITLILMILLVILVFKMQVQNKMLEEKNHQLAEIDRMKTEFLANVSHELRTPLTVIMGYSELLLERMADDENASVNRKFVETVYRKSEDLLSLINDLIELSRIESGRIEMRLTQFSLAEVVDETVEELATNTMKKQHVVEVTHNDPELLMEADRGKIKQIIANLVHNAIKYTPNGGRILIRTYTNDHTGCIEVEDNGIGMSEEQIRQLYQPFKQANSSYNKKYEGFGLGLAITKSLVQYHRGTISVCSHPGEGSCFTVKLPVETF